MMGGTCTECSMGATWAMMGGTCTEHNMGGRCTDPATISKALCNLARATANVTLDPVRASCTCNL
eukprot:1159485-Pelagomonas_calceolata.AAC.3